MLWAYAQESWAKKCITGGTWFCPQETQGQYMSSCIETRAPNGRTMETGVLDGDFGTFSICAPCHPQIYREIKFTIDNKS